MPQRFNPCLYLLVLVVTGSTNAQCSNFTPSLTLWLPLSLTLSPPEAPSPLHVSCPVLWTLLSGRIPPLLTSYAQLLRLTATFDPSCVVWLFQHFFFNIWALDCSISSQSITVFTSLSGLHGPSPQPVLPILSTPLFPKISCSAP